MMRLAVYRAGVLLLSLHCSVTFGQYNDPLCKNAPSSQDTEWLIRAVNHHFDATPGGAVGYLSKKTGVKAKIQDPKAEKTARQYLLSNPFTDFESAKKEEQAVGLFSKTDPRNNFESELNSARQDFLNSEVITRAVFDGLPAKDSAIEAVGYSARDAVNQFFEEELAKKAGIPTASAQRVSQLGKSIPIEFISEPKYSESTSSPSYRSPVHEYWGVDLPKAVKLGPELRRAAAGRPDLIRFSFLHEYSHRYGARVIQFNGIGLGTKFYKKLLSCMHQTIQSRGDDEIIADWIASNVLAREISKQKNPLAKKKMAQENLFTLCHLTEFYASYKSLGYENHPSPHERIQEIYLKTPEIRSALGLAPASYCSLEGEVRLNNGAKDKSALPATSSAD